MPKLFAFVKWSAVTLVFILVAFVTFFQYKVSRDVAKNICKQRVFTKYGIYSGECEGLTGKIKYWKDFCANANGYGKDILCN